MVDGSNLADKLDIAGACAQYDTEAVSVLNDKLLLAYILVHTVSEFKGMKPEEVVDLIEDVKTSKVPVNPGETNNPNIVGDNTESKIPFEGKATFDIRCHVWAPGKTGKIKIIIDLEAQGKFFPGYDLVTRGEFYDARLISAQKSTEFTEDDYDNIKKVYSIFICFNAPKYAENTITKFCMHQENIVGNMPLNKFRYDIPNVVLVCLSNELAEEKDELRLHRLLGTVFSDSMTSNEKKELIQNEFDIDMSINKEGRMKHMSGLGESILVKGYNRGMEEGKAETLIESIRNLMSSLKLSSEQAMDALKIPEEDRMTYLAEINK